MGTDVAISSTAKTTIHAPINIVNLRFSMLIPVSVNLSALLEIPTALRASE